MAGSISHYGKWRIRWFDFEGNRRSEVYASKADADFALRRHQVEVEEIRRGLRLQEPPDKHFDQLCDYWLTTRAVQKRSWKDDQSIIRHHLRPFFGKLLLKNVTLEKVDQFIASRQHLNQKTVHNFLTLIISMLNLAVDHGWLAKTPKIRKPQIRIFASEYRYLRTDEEIERFLRSARESSERQYVLYATAIYTGMRQGELAGLKWEDVDFERRLITVQRSFEGPTKAGDIRYVPILDPLLPLLREWKLKTPGGYVFQNTYGNMLKSCVRIFQEDFRTVLRRAGFAPRREKGRGQGYITFHDLRHSFASRWVICGGDIFRLQTILGHKSIAMTMRYSHLSPHAFASDYNRLGSAREEKVGKIISLSR